MPKRTYAMRYAAGRPVERIFPERFCELTNKFPVNKVLSAEHMFRVMVWNIYKQQRGNWLSVLQRYSQDSQLVLLQEAQATPELVSFATRNYLAVDQVPAFVLPQHPSGVMTLATAHALYCCPLCEREPLLRLSKSALVTVYPLSNGSSLMVVNIHAVNFSLGMKVYSKQLDPIGTLLNSHHGPVIMAGDFNAWSKQRIGALYHFAQCSGLNEVRFENDRRKRAFGRPLDFIFYRDLNVLGATVLVTNASDHNPLLVEFSSDVSSW